MTNRLKKIQESFESENLDFLLIDSFPNRYYLTGFTGSAGYLLVPKSGPSQLFVDSRYLLQAKRQTVGLSVVEFENFYRLDLAKFANEHKSARVGFESTHISHDKLRQLKKFGKKLNWVPTKGLVEGIRKVKDESEIKALKKALKISDEAFSEIRKIIKVGVTEREVAFKLEMMMRSLGAQKSAWEPLIVATGKNSAYPHHGHSNSKLKKGDTIQLDYGCVVDMYHTDTSRVVFLGQPSDKQRELYDLVLRSQMLGISLVKSQIEGGFIDSQVKEFLKGSSHGVYKHGLGHGVGLEIHEAPTLYVSSQDRLETGEVITIEPGIYLEDFGGMRLEDMVLVKDDGCEVLTKATKKLEEVVC